MKTQRLFATLCTAVLAALPALSVRAEDIDVFTSRGGHLVRADGFPPHPERFARLGVDLAALLRPRG